MKRDIMKKVLLKGESAFVDAQLVLFTKDSQRLWFGCKSYLANLIDLKTRQSLTNANWTGLSPSLTLTNGQYCALLPATNRASFYRLKTP